MFCGWQNYVILFNILQQFWLPPQHKRYERLKQLGWEVTDDRITFPPIEIAISFLMSDNWAVMRITSHYLSGETSVSVKGQLSK